MHQCAHHHHPPGKDYGWAFAIGVALNVVFVIVEATYGWWAGSLALLADAGHNLSDVVGLLMAWGGYALAKVKPTPHRTYGWRGSTILAALGNAMLLMIVVGGIAWEALGRMADPPPVNGPVVITVAAIGVVINTATALLFMRGRKTDLNLRGAYLHMAADALLSLGVVVAGAVIMATGWLWIDPVTSLVIAVVILIGTWGLMRDSFHLALQAVPPEIVPDEVESFLAELPGVSEVHDLHIWAISTTETSLTAHLVCPIPANHDHLLAQINQTLHQRFKIDHSTIQIETSIDDSQCSQWEEGSL